MLPCLKCQLRTCPSKKYNSSFKLYSVSVLIRLYFSDSILNIIIILSSMLNLGASHVALVIKKKFTCQCRRYLRCRFNPSVGKIPWRRKWQPTPVVFPGKFHGQKNLTATVHKVTKSRTRLKQLSTHAPAY